MTSQHTTQHTAIRPDATIQIQQSCDACHGVGETAEGAICVTCWGTRRVTLRVTLRELSEALGEMLPTIARHASVMPAACGTSDALGY